MDRSRWSAISKDPEIWKKIGMGAGTLSLIFSAPVALGIVNMDLEAEAARVNAKAPPSSDNSLPPVDDISKILMAGFGPTMVALGSLMMFAIATIPTGLSYFQLYAYFRPVNELVPELHQQLNIPITSLLMYFIIGAIGLALQALVAFSLPVALARYARGGEPMAALSVLRNAVTVLEMGMPFWLKATGVFVGLLGMTMIFITGGFGLGWIASTVVWLLVCAALFVSLILSSRMALAHLTAELAPMNLPPLPPVVE